MARSHTALSRAVDIAHYWRKIGIIIGNLRRTRTTPQARVEPAMSKREVELFSRRHILPHNRVSYGCLRYEAASGAERSGPASRRTQDSARRSVLPQSLTWPAKYLDKPACPSNTAGNRLVRARLRRCVRASSPVPSRDTARGAAP